MSNPFNSDYQETNQQARDYTQYYDQEDRTGCLTIWIIASLLLGSVALIGFLGVFALIAGNPSNVESNELIGLSLLLFALILSLVSLIGMWNWKRWGIAGFFIATLLSPVAESIYGSADISDWIAIPVQIGILFYLVSTNSKNFKDNRM